MCTFGCGGVSLKEMEMELKKTKAAANFVACNPDRNPTSMYGPSPIWSLVKGEEKAIREALSEIHPGIKFEHGFVYAHRGSFKVNDDGSSIFIWDGVPILEFGPIEMNNQETQAGATLTLTQSIRRLDK